jgi:hypothetical protein
VLVFPGLKELRYLIPFRGVEQCITYFRNASLQNPGGAAAFGDDMEKFGVWPGTYKHCYEDGWLETFFAALEENSDWLQTITPGDYIASHPALGRADLPTASYAEMMEWVLPTNTRLRLCQLHKEFAHRPDLLGFVRGGGWRGFLRKYPESNLLHKKMLRVSSTISSAPPRHASPEHSAQLHQARDLLLRAQNNDAYWHGVFGGLYAPHLRTELWRNLVRAETIVDQLTPGGQMPRVETVDYDADGDAELLFTSREYQALLKPNDGATLAMFDFRPASATVINSMQRRPEPYHSRVREAAGGSSHSGAVSIHDQVRVKEPNLERLLRYDRFARHSFRVLLFDPACQFSDYESLQLAELPGPACGKFETRQSSANHGDFRFSQPVPEYAADRANPPLLTITKRFLFGPAPMGCELSCDLTLEVSNTLARPVRLGIESIINFLAPSADDRFFETPQGPQNLRYSGTLSGPMLRLEDGWQRIRATLHAPGTDEFWIAPIETVSESEAGFERVYQGSQILSLWRPNLTEKLTAAARLMHRFESI